MSTTTAPPAPPASPTDPTDRLEPPGRRVSHPWIAAAAVVVVALVLLGIGLIPPGAVVLSLPFLYLLARKPVLRRLAVRNATRRPKETLLIVLGALLGTAIITSSYVVGDTLTASIHQSAYTQLGPVDEVILANGPGVGTQVQAAVSRAQLRDVDGTLPILAVQAAVSTAGPGVPKAEPKAQVLETDFTQARGFGGDPAATGISGPTPTGDQAVIGADLASTLEVAAGGPVTVYAYGTSRTFQVVRVLPRLGVAGLYSLTSATGRSGSPNLFVPVGTLTALQASGPLGRSAAPPVSVLAVSNRGSVTGGVGLTAAVHGELDSAVHGLPVLITDAKKSLIDAANTAGKSFTQLFQTFGYFSVAVGVLLLINIFVMLAQERKQTLGMLRAVGLRRASLVGSFSLEGWFYAVLSALAGTLVGIGIGRLVITATSRIFNSGGRNNLALHFSASVRSLQSGFLFGFVIALLTVVLTSLYVARLNVIRAIRDLPEPPNDGPRTSTLVIGALLTLAGGLLTVVGVTGSGAAVPALVGPALLGSGLAMVTLGRIPVRLTVTVISIAVIVWSILAQSVLRHAFDKASIAVFFIQGLILNVFAVVLVTFNQQAVGAVIRAIGGGTRNMSLRLGLAYPLAKRFRTGLLLAMYAIVVFLLVLLTTISAFFGSQINDQIRKVGGGAAVIVDSNQAEPVPAAEVSRLPGVTAVAPTAAQVAQFRLGTGKYNDYTAVGFDAALIGHGTPDLHTWDKKRYPTQADVYRAALADRTRILVGRNFGSSNFGPPGTIPAVGARATVRDRVSGQAVDVTIVGLISDSFYDNADHVLMARDLSIQVFGTRATPNLLYLSTAPGTDNDALATSINGRYIANGADANSFRKLVNDSFSIQNQFFTLIRGYVALGLLVGIAGLGVVMVRAVRERRREVGVLRALGFSGIAVRRAFLAESSFIALEGIAVGTGLALITAWQLVDSGSFGSGTRFTVPFLQLSVLIVATFVASLIATAAPAIQASHIRPAVALRIAD